MKLLIVGIDGGDAGIFSRMPMPRMQARMSAGCQIPLVEDLLSRGWIEILSGNHARETKAFYMVAKCDGTDRIEFKYSLAELLSVPAVKPIWELPPGDSTVGMMNVPTTFPAPNVNGFFVSGAGGGVNKVEGIPRELCHPPELADELEQMGYTIDIRFGTEGIRDIEVLFDKLCLMLQQRLTAFLKLNQLHTPDFSFVVFRAPTVIQYLAMSEMEDYFSRQAKQQIETHGASEAWRQGLERLYETLDHCIEQAIVQTDPDHWMVTSDHGAVPYRYRVDINRWLQDHGFQKYQTRWEKVFRSARKAITSSAPFFIDRRSDLKLSEAFGHWYLSGIFVNDQRRFGGPVSEAEVESVTDQLIDEFNNDPEASKHSMRAVRYRSQHPSARFHDQLPDVKIECPDEYFFSVFPGPFIRPNPDYLPLQDISSVSGGMYTGQKGRNALLCCDPQTAALVRENDPSDLTLVYRLTERLFA